MTGPTMSVKTVRMRCLRPFWLHGRSVQIDEVVDAPHLAALEIINARRGVMLDPEAMADIQLSVDAENRRTAAEGRSTRNVGRR